MNSQLIATPGEHPLKTGDQMKTTYVESYSFSLRDVEPTEDYNMHESPQEQMRLKLGR
jgi:hypothetical protein